MNNLGLTPEEMNKIATPAREARPFANYTLPMHADKSIDLLKNFIKGYVFLQTLSVKFDIPKEIQEKMQTYIVQFKDLYLECVKLNRGYESDINFGQNIINKKIDKFLDDNRNTISLLIIETFSIGKITKTFDPDAHTAAI